MRSLVRVVEPPYTWRVPRTELDSARQILPVLSNLENGNSRPIPLEDTPHKSVYRLPALRAKMAIYVKVYRRDSWRYLLRTPPGTREARTMIKLRQIGVPVSDLLAVGMRRHFPFRAENLLVVRSPANLWTLGRWCLCEFREHGEEARRRVTPVLARVLAAVRRMHDAGIFHGDLNPGNILIDPDGKEFLFIDFHCSSTIWVQSVHRRTDDICTLFLQLHAHYNLSEIFDLICAYAPGSGFLSGIIRARWEETAAKIRQRWTSHIVDHCCDSQTHFRRVKSDTATLYMDRSYHPDAILEFACGGCNAGEWTCEALSGTQEEARACWREAVRRGATEEISETPIALLCQPPAEGPHLLIWDPNKPPPYRLSYLLSLEPYDPDSQNCLLKILNT